MTKRVVIGGIFALALGYAIAFAVGNAERAASTAALPSQGGAQLLFDSAAWLVWLAPFLGVFAAGFTRRKDPRIEGDRVLRHDGAAIVEHWSHGVGTVVLLITGFSLGAIGLPRFVNGAYAAGAALDVHFVGAVLFLFGSTYYAANSALSERWREHLPHDLAGSVSGVVAHYKALFSRSEMPAEGKYFASEHLTYPVAVLGSAVILLTGLVKVAAHAFAIPAPVMGFTTATHDIAAIVVGVFLVAHAIAGALVPWSWPLLRSMFTGYVTLDYARHHHEQWVEQLTTGEDEQSESEQEVAKSA